MEIGKRLRFFYFAYLSYPSRDRIIYRHVVRHLPRNIVEIGLGRGIRAQRLLEVICGRLPADEVLYTGIDLFEACPPQLGQILPLKQVYQKLRHTGARIRLYPGDPAHVLAQRANQLGPVDLLILSRPLGTQSLPKAWCYIPRMLHPDAFIFLEEQAGFNSSFRKWSSEALQAWVESRQASKAA